MAEVLGIKDLKWFYSFSVLLDDLKWKDKKMEKGGDKGQPLQWVGDCLIFSCFFIVSNVILVGLFMQTQQRQGEGGTSDIHPLMLGTPSGPPYHHPLTDLFLLSDPIIIFLFLPFFFLFSLFSFSLSYFSYGSRDIHKWDPKKPLPVCLLLHSNFKAWNPVQCTCGVLVLMVQTTDLIVHTPIVIQILGFWNPIKKTFYFRTVCPTVMVSYELFGIWITQSWGPLVVEVLRIIYIIRQVNQWIFYIFFTWVRFNICIFKDTTSVRLQYAPDPSPLPYPKDPIQK